MNGDLDSDRDQCAAEVSPPNSDPVTPSSRSDIQDDDRSEVEERAEQENLEQDAVVLPGETAGENEASETKEAEEDGSTDAAEDTNHLETDAGNSEIGAGNSETAAGEIDDADHAQQLGADDQVDESKVLLEALEELTTKSDALSSLFDSKIRYDASREAIIERQHNEIQEYRADLVLKILKPMAMDLLHLHDDMGKSLEAWQAKVADNDLAAKLLRLLNDFRSDIEDMLDRNGFVMYVEAEEKFNSRRQNALRRSKTDDPGQHHMVEERLRKGLMYEDKVLRPEMVTVKVFSRENSRE